VSPEETNLAAVDRNLAAVAQVENGLELVAIELST
jgi:hypothetical protein